MHKTPSKFKCSANLHDDDTDAEGDNNDGIEPSGQQLGVWVWFGLWGGWVGLGWEVLWRILQFVMRAWVVIADDDDDNDNYWWKPQKTFASKFICCTRNLAPQIFVVQKEVLMLSFLKLCFQKKEKKTFHLSGLIFEAKSSYWNTNILGVLATVKMYIPGHGQGDYFCIFVFLYFCIFIFVILYLCNW